MFQLSAKMSPTHRCGGSLACYFAAALVWLTFPQLARSDTLDIEVRLYPSSSCMERIEELFVLDDGCYANLYTNLTKAYKLKITGFDDDKTLDLYEYLDDCETPFSPARTLSANKCVRFVGGFFAILNLRLRSTTCEGASCSRLAVTHQRFYSEAGCQGLPFQIYTYPVQNECMRWSNGTQAFAVDPTNSNITQVDYVMNDKCEGDLIRQYNMENRNCYELYPDKAPRSFMWTITRYDADATADGWRPPVLGAAQATALAAPLALLGRPADL
eukprot:TRINITY_DN109023_c0_g1_i1.p1 TRINITY_DN109023_c0_g1~~TRINITY_DN109023_c0_g1_i1.p1  ORF type:complete len:281 (+),score=44.23 TRINITY_DN109023_c0_g1_i1:29-844(+)